MLREQLEAARVGIAARVEVEKAELRVFAAETKALLAEMRANYLERQLAKLDLGRVELPSETWAKR